MEGLFVFAEANKMELTREGKTKTVKLPNGTLSWYSPSPSVSVENPEKVIAALEALGLDRFVRIKKEVDKEAVKKEPEIAEQIQGLSIKPKKDEFIISPANLGISFSASGRKKFKRVAA